MITYNHFIELFWNLTHRRNLIDQDQLKRFWMLNGRYAQMCDLYSSYFNDQKILKSGYDWENWRLEIRQAFKHGVPLDFLSCPTLVKTMVLARRGGISAASILIQFTKNVFGEEITKRLLKEDYIGLPTMQNVSYQTSTNCSRLANHLAHYTRECKRMFWDTTSVLEWGGGYGKMARIIRKMNPLITYIIVDLPELLALQYIDLASLEGEDNVVLNFGEEKRIVPGKINLISALEVISKKNWIHAESFLSTWAITESPRDSQEFVMNHQYFGAEHILLGFKIDEHNFLINSLPKEKIQRIPVPLSQRLGESNEYWFC